MKTAPARRRIALSSPRYRRATGPAEMPGATSAYQPAAMATTDVINTASNQSGAPGGTATAKRLVK